MQTIDNYNSGKFELIAKVLPLLILLLLLILLMVWTDYQCLVSPTMDNSINYSTAPITLRRKRITHSDVPLEKGSYLGAVMVLYKIVEYKREFNDDNLPETVFTFSNEENQIIEATFKLLASQNPSEVFSSEKSQLLGSDMGLSRRVVKLYHQYLISGGKFTIEVNELVIGLLNFIAFIDRKETDFIPMMLGLSLRRTVLEICEFLEPEKWTSEQKQAILEAMEKARRNRSTLDECFKLEEAYWIWILRRLKRLHPLGYHALYLLQGDPIRQLKQVLEEQKNGAKGLDPDSLNELLILPNFPVIRQRMNEYLELETAFMRELSSAPKD